MGTCAFLFFLCERAHAMGSAKSLSLAVIVALLPASIAFVSPQNWGLAKSRGDAINSMPWAPRMVAASPAGFGVAKKSKASSSKKPMTKNVEGVDAKALELLQIHKSLPLAQAHYFQDNCLKLKQKDPSMFAKLVELQQQQSQEKPSPASGEVHDKLVEITWDTMSAFLPLMGSSASPGSEVDGKFGAIARCVAEAGHHVLDVGCGDGKMIEAHHIPCFLSIKSSTEYLRHHFRCSSARRQHSHTG